MLAFIGSAIAAFVGLVVVDKRVATPLIDVDQMASRHALPLIVATILSFASSMVVVSFIIPSIAQNDSFGFAASGTATAVLFITPGSLASLVAAPLVGRLGAKIGFVAVLRWGLIAGVAVTAALAVFAFGIMLAVALTPMSALGVLQAPEGEPGSLPGISNAACGIGGSLGSAWAAPVIADGTRADFQLALWICAGISVVAVAASLILRPRPAALPAPK
jgi:MFS family permease